MALAIIKNQLNTLKYIFVSLLIILISCSNNDNQQSSDTSYKSDSNNIQQQNFKKIEVKNVQHYDTLIKTISETLFNDSIKVFITNEYKLPKFKKLKYDSTFYQIGTFINIGFINETHMDYKIDIGRKTGTPKEIWIWECPFETKYNWILASKMIIESDMRETCLIGFMDNQAKLIAQEVSMNLDEVIIKDSTLIFSQKYVDPFENGSNISIDSVRINIYNGERFEINILDTVEYYN